MFVAGGGFPCRRIRDLRQAIRPCEAHRAWPGIALEAGNSAGAVAEEVASMMCTVIKKLGKELGPAVYPVNVTFVHRVLVKTDTGVEARG
jgi:hypothetical protein